ncbi:PAB1-binding protein 2 [Spathaspora sp. JA1]|nr:PAB1-binding protein 2 [Spathaspora sp. JA1]
MAKIKPQPTEPEEDYDEELDEDYDPTKVASDDEDSQDSEDDNIPGATGRQIIGRFVTDEDGLVKNHTSLDIDSIFNELKRGESKIIESREQQQQVQPIEVEKNKDKQIKIQTSYTYAGKLITETKLVDADSEEAKAYLNSTSSILTSDDGKNRSEVNVVRKDVITGEMKSLSTLEKSRLDWASFVDKRKIGDELKTFNKAGYLDKQAFLGRVDSKRDEKYIEAKEAAARTSNSSSSLSNSNVLKRKNEEDEDSTSELTKRVALDSEQLDQVDRQQEESITAPVIGGGEEQRQTEEQEVPKVEPEAESEPVTEPVAEPVTEPVAPQQPVVEQATVPVTVPVPPAESVTDSHYSEPTQYEQSITSGSDSKPVSSSNHRDSDPTYVQFRMYCPVKEASCIVGKKGEKINHLREKANVRINISDNFKGVPERIVSVKGSSENVARAFGLITRTILDEPEDEPASMMSQQYNLKLLVPHPMIGFIIGKQGLKFREIEESSAAKLRAAEQPLPYSTDRVLSVTGVADAIHIAVYYIAQVMIEHKDCLKKNKIVYYNPSNYHHGNISSSMMALGAEQQQQPHHQQQQQSQQRDPYNMPYGQQQPQQMQKPAASPYNFQTMFQPSIYPQQHQPLQQQPGQYGNSYGNMNMGAPPVSSGLPSNIPPQNQYIDEHGNTIIGDVITNPPIQAGPSPDKFNQDVFVANASIGSVIGKGGNNIKHIRENSGCSYVKIEPDRGQSIMLGGGKGLTNIRKLTLTGSLNSIQMAIYLINQRINQDKERNGPHH